MIWLSSMKYLVYGSIIFLLSYNVHASSITAIVKLKEIKALKVSEASGDEVYFTVTHYSNRGVSDHQRVPHFPHYWLSRHLTAVHDVILWKQEILLEEAIQIILSLVEHDAPPFNVDDHLGSIKLILQNNQGQLVSKWMKADFTDQPLVSALSEKLPAYNFKTDHGEYMVTFSLETTA